MNRRAGAIEVLHEGLQAALVLKDIRLVLALIHELDAYARVEEGELAQPLGENVVVELDMGEDLPARPEAHHCAPLRGIPHDRQWRHGIAEMVFLPVHLSVAIHGEKQVVGQRIHDGHTDPVEATRDLVGAVVEFPAGMQDGHDDFCRRSPLLLVHIYGNTAAIVGDRHRFVGVNGHYDLVAVAGQRLVDGVVHDLEHHVVQTGAVIRVTDVHPRALSHRVEAF